MKTVRATLRKRDEAGKVKSAEVFRAQAFGAVELYRIADRNAGLVGRWQ